MEITMKKYTPVDYDFVYQLKKVCYYPYVSEIWGWDEEKQTDYFNAFMENAKENMNIIYSRGKRIGMINWSVDGDTCEPEKYLYSSGIPESGYWLPFTGRNN